MRFHLGPGRLTALVLVALALPSGARGDDGREPMAVLGIEGVGVAPELGSGLTAALRRALAKRDRVAVMPGKDLVEMRFVFGCTDEGKLGECLGTACRSLVVNRVVFGSVREVSARGRKTGAYFVRLRLLDVNAGVIAPVEVHETVLPERLRPPLLDEAADRWMAVLVGGAAPRGGVVATPQGGPASEAARAATGSATAPPDGQPGLGDYQPGDAGDERPGRRLLIGGVVATVLAAVAFGVSIATWRRYVDEQGSAHQALVDLGNQQGAYYQANRGFFASPSCSLPATPALPAGADGAYVQSCATGQSFASATTGMIVTGAVLAALGVTGIVVGNHLDRRDRARGGKRASLAPSPVAGPGGLGLSF